MIPPSWLQRLWGRRAPASTSMPRPELAAGQEWSVGSAPQLAAKIVIGRIEPWRGQTVVHISIIDIQPAAADSAALRMQGVAHTPFERSALAQSLGELLATGVAPLRDFEEGYQQWKDANGGIFRVSIPEAIRVMAQTLEQRS